MWFRYTGLVDVSLENASSLLDLSHCYILVELQRQCAFVLKSQISDASAIPLYELGNLYASDDLRVSALSHIAERYDRVVRNFSQPIARRLHSYKWSLIPEGLPKHRSRPGIRY